MLVKEAAVMPAPLTRAAPPAPSAAPMVPQPLWPHLSSGHPQHVRQVCISVAQHWVAPRPHSSLHEEMSHDLHAAPESRKIAPATS
jgi:hypothetical protein